MTINRYKINKAGVAKAIRFLKSGKGHLDVPTWVEKFKSQLKIKNGKLHFEGREIVPREDVDKYLRKRLYSKGDDAIQTSRDSAHYQLLKETVGITRRVLMDFLKAQRTLGETRSALPEPKSKGGKRIDGYVLETDLVFVKKDDLVAANPRFEKKHEPDLVYILTTVEKATGLCQLAYVTSKEANVVTPKVIEHIKWFNKKLKTKIGEIRMDSGTEFSHKLLKPHIKKSTKIPMGPSVERKNRQIQSNFYRILKNRQALTIRNALSKAENMANNCYSRIQKKTPMEAAEQKSEESVKRFNKKRTKFISRDRRKPLEVGDFVRVQTKTLKDSAIGYKTYKNKTFTENVFKVKKRTTSTPYRYWVDKKWRLLHTLLKTRPRDEESNKLIEDRDMQQKKLDKEEEKREDEKAAEAIEKNQKRLEMEKKKNDKILPSVSRGRKNLAKIRAGKKRMKALDEVFEKEDEEKLELKKLYKYVVREERDYKTYDHLPLKEQEKRLAVWNKNTERAKSLVQQGVKVKGVPRNFFTN